ncbi:TPA: electron transport complex subunit RsxC [Mannheimia haemolytica]|uniref:Ion-translocating oxidoreductase complex subunit C n=4 Tax=Mannheimia haemolytica TaxID=75985 RepID=A0A547ERM2_MANHA|nr:electron transport complex subunit RsxC [Mannheimia haemolytica]AWW72091.1 electron transport complex subunit RsxC [Pasteurellaceae bacterium 12565]AGI33376.1 electron transport complex subunit RsxC [Mannheimia haemolytica USDA-ARS-USMARC-183]AGI34658.1 electron transport complex subunit RsxC [Mannheimia haemolytica USDA-ARS-USMARC-185]AGK01709.1 electron transport complex protein RnfC [Mannheimia haemolytica M42548]AGQ26512.1 electron transporter RnfC [Mannheimia haemolytica D153]
MSNPNLVIERIRQNKETGKLWDFPGGIHPMENKSQSNSKPIRTLNLPKFFYVPLVQHSGWAGELLVKVGDVVLKGQPLTKGDHFRQLPVHSPTSGRVIGIEPYVSAHASGLPEITVIIETDGKDKWVERQPIEDFLSLTSDQIIQKVYQYGIAGLGGAVFPTATKLSLADKRCKLLVINGAECEPYITCDDRLMQDFTADLIEGIRILRYVLRPEEVVIAIEDNKPHAIQALETALKGSNDMFVRAIPTKYPSGASDQLIQVLTGLEIPAGKRTIEMGIVMHNVGTAFAVKRAIIDDEPLIERVVTLTGDKIRNKGNVWARLGTPIQHLLEQVDYQADKRFPVFLGGPMMGFILPALQAPITKTANCLIAPDHFEYAPPEPERSCIRCSSCSDACPVGLLPQQLYWFARAEDHDKSKEYHLDACIECGVCAYVCPSYIPLIQYFRQEKAKIEEIEEKARKAEEAKIRFEAREARLQKERDARTARISQAAEKRREEVANAGGVDPVKAALERLKAKKAVETVQEIPAEVQVKPNGEPDNSDLMAQRRARRLAKQAEQAVEKSENVTNALIGANNDLPLQSMNETASDKSVGANNYSPEAESEDPRKAAVAAALARAKAKKQAQQAVEKSENITNAVIGVNNDLPLQSMNETVSDKSVGANNHSPETESEDPRKAAVAAAIARAKAKKQAQQAVEKPEDIANAVIGVNNDLPLQSMNETTSDKSVGANNHSPKTESEDPRKAAVAAAIARAKAKKAAQQEKSNNV